KIDNMKYPPIWLAINLMTFGQIINLIELMSTNNIRQIAKQYDCSDAELLSWLKCLNFSLISGEVVLFNSALSCFLNFSSRYFR
ncbi:Abi family protein, partial [Streptococcus suis]|uniref:Abi family protein n=1 Tax=Streptococcus suis TaxID=1307 RepID=UPI0025B20504